MQPGSGLLAAHACATFLASCRLDVVPAFCVPSKKRSGMQRPFESHDELQLAPCRSSRLGSSRSVRFVPFHLAHEQSQSLAAFPRGKLQHAFQHLEPSSRSLQLALREPVLVLELVGKEAVIAAAA